MRKPSVLVLLMVLLGFVQAVAQNRTVSGKVTAAADGTGLPGVSISLKGTSRGTTTNGDGVYKLEVPEQGTLVFTYVGYTSQEVSIGNRTIIDVQMAEDNAMLQEVQVVAYGTQTKKSITGSQVQVGGEEVANIPFSTPQQALQGKIPGVQISASTGQPGAFQSIRIRGIGSINASAEPLYVVDGVPINANSFGRIATSTNPLAGINSNDIESVTVLKDAASASIYGSRAANGVILITTKSGKGGKTKFRFDTEVGNSGIAIPDLAKPLNAEEYLMLTKEGLVNANASAAQQTSILNALGANRGVDTDWFNLVTRTGAQQQYNMSASGGDNKTQFYVSGGYFQQQAPVIGSDFDRISGKVNLRHNATQKLSFKTNITFARNGIRTPGNGGQFANPILAAYFLLPTTPAYNGDGTSNYSLTDFPAIYNPIAYVEYQRRGGNSLQTIGNLGASYQLIKNLTLSSTIGIDYLNAEELQYDNPFFGDGRTVNGRSFAFYTRTMNWNWVNMADYRLNLTPSQDIYADFKLGYESQLSKLYGISARGDGFPPNTNLVLPVVAASPNVASAFGSDYSFASVFSTANFNFKDRYSLSASLRRDGSSRFGSDNRYGTFWSVGGAWNIDEENFFQNISNYISSMKLRASYGTNGNGGIGNYSWRPTYGYGFNYNQQPGSAPNNIGNTALTWEINKPFNVGLDFGVLNERLAFVVDYYVRTTSSLLLNVPTSQTTGFSSRTENLGSMENRGWEFAVNASPFKGDFTWNLNFNIALNRNKVLDLYQNQDILNGRYMIREGQDFQTWYVREWAGVNPDNGAPQWYANKKNADGTFTRDIVNNYNGADRVLYGSASPRGFGGFSSDMSFKGIYLNTQFTYGYGNLVNDIWSRYTQSDGWSPSFNKSRVMLNRWQKPGDITDVPKYVYNNATNSQEFSTRFLYKGDYIRLRNIELGYSLPKSLLSRINMNETKIYARGTNIWTYTADKRLTFDPENGINGQNNFDIFMPRTVTLGINVGF